MIATASTLHAARIHITLPPAQKRFQTVFTGLELSTGEVPPPDPSAAGATAAPLLSGGLAAGGFVACPSAVKAIRKTAIPANVAGGNRTPQRRRATLRGWRVMRMTTFPIQNPKSKIQNRVMTR